MTSHDFQEVVTMVGMTACGSVSSIKALWETRIRKVQQEEEEQRRRTVGGAPGRSDSMSSAHCWYLLVINTGSERGVSIDTPTYKQTDDVRAI